MDAGGLSLKFLLSSLFILYAVSSVIQVMLRCALPEKAAEGRVSLCVPVLYQLEGQGREWIQRL